MVKVDKALCNFTKLYYATYNHAFLHFILSVTTLYFLQIAHLQLYRHCAKSTEFPYHWAALTFLYLLFRFHFRLLPYLTCCACAKEKCILRALFPEITREKPFVKSSCYKKDLPDWDIAKIYIFFIMEQIYGRVSKTNMAMAFN